jgi:hypothetical protein
VLSCRAALPLSRRTLTFLPGPIRSHRKKIGCRRRSNQQDGAQAERHTGQRGPLPGPDIVPICGVRAPHHPPLLRDRQSGRHVQYVVPGPRRRGGGRILRGQVDWAQVASVMWRPVLSTARLRLGAP